MRWLPVPGYEGFYQISDTGIVESVDRVVKSRWGTPKPLRGKRLKQSPDSDGHLRVTLCRDGIESPRFVHQLVLLTFVGPRPPGLVGCHSDDDPRNNHVGNLRWDTHSSNSFDMVKNGKHWEAAKTECPQRHEYTPENTYRAPNRPNKRDCLTCRRERSRAFRAKAAS